MTIHDAVIIGSGFGGQAAAVSLRREGIDDFVILERRDFIGGTWCQNSYPGAAVDVQSHLYCFSFEPYDWSQVFADGPELQRYTDHVLDKYRIRDKVQLNAEVTEVRWDEDAACWRVQTAEAGTFSGRAVINASGPLSNPVIPDVPGRDSFQGVSFHTNAWDHSFDYRGKRVAVVGSGASAAQVIPEIAPDVSELHVFQRTPHWVMPRGDRVFSPWERRIVNQPLIAKAFRTLMYWSLETRVIGFKYSRPMLDLVAGRSARGLLTRQVKDPVLRAKLTPDYTIGCKRIILSNTLYPALTRANTTLHDREDAIAEITPTGIRTTQGTDVELDAIIWATGYDATEHPVSYDVIGRNGLTMAEAWAEFPRAYLGTAAPGFPNLFIIIGPNTGIGHTSAVFIIESQMQYVRDCLRQLRKAKASSIEPTPEAEAAYTEMIHREMTKTVWADGGCHSWYQSKSGKVIAMFPGFSFTYRHMTGNFRPDDHLVA